MSEPITANPPIYNIQQTQVGFPVVVRRATSGSATFLVSTSAARRLLPGPALEVAELLPGKALCSIAIIDYQDNDLGDYNEVSIALFVRPAASEGGSRGIPYLGTVMDMMRNRLGTYIHHLPVDQGFTCEAGCTIWGFPKTVQQIDFDYQRDSASCRLVYEGEHALTSEVVSLPTPGHTPGHVSFVVSSGGEKAYLITDAAHIPAQLSETDWSIDFDTDKSISRQTRHSLFDRIEADGALIASGHFPYPGLGHVIREGGKRLFKAI